MFIAWTESEFSRSGGAKWFLTAFNRPKRVAPNGARVAFGSTLL